MLHKLRTRIQEHIVVPIMQAHAPPSEIAWGAGIGMFVAMTPTVGIQMYAVTAVWFITRYIFRFNFNLPVGLAMCWISNPITMGPLYYLFLLVGYWIFPHLGFSGSIPVTYADFGNRLSEILAHHSTRKVVRESFSFLIVELGFPMLVGSVLIALPCAILTFWITILTLHRRKPSSNGASMPSQK